jgi:hypothetical protein
MVRLSAFARLLYIGSWNFALCDRGHLPDDPMGLKLKVLPADQVDPYELVDELVKLGRFIRRTTSDGRQFLHIVRLADHQKLDPRWSSKCPFCAVESEPTEPPPDSPSLPETPASHTEPPPDSPQYGIGGDRRVEEKNNNTSAMPTRDLSVARADVERLCEHLADRIAGNGAKRPTVTKRWRDAARLMLDADDRPEAAVHQAIDWCQDSEFWRANVLSMPKLRDKYDQLSLQAKSQRNRASPQAKPSTTDLRVAQAQALKGPGQASTLAEIFERTGHRPRTIPGEIA